MILTTCLVLVVCGLELLYGAQDMPWRIVWDDALPTVTDLAGMNDGPITDERRISAKGGHLYERTGKRVRLLGVNFVWDACFPDKAEAPIIAKRLRKLGVNLVRMHNMDIGAAPKGIFDPADPEGRRLDADQLDRFDYLVAQLKEQGIYVDLNLWVGRNFGKVGPVKNQIGALNTAGKSSLYFYPPFQEYFREFARDLLTHKNPYTGLTYAEDPIVAFVEIINELSLIYVNPRRALSTLPPPLQKSLDQQWNKFLQSKYGKTSHLVEAWFGELNKTPPGDNLLENPHFEDGLKGWMVQVLKQPSQVRSSIAPANIPELKAQNALWVSIPKEEFYEPSQIQLHQSGLNLPSGAVCTVSFWARSDAPRSLGVNLLLDRKPWDAVSAMQMVDIDTEWRQFTLIFHLLETVPEHTRLSFSLGGDRSDVALADVQLRIGADIKLPDGQSLEAQNISLPSNSNLPQGQDAIAFLSQLELHFLETMRHYLRGDLGVRAPIIGTQAHMGGLPGVWRDSHMDVVDMHSYWNHPAYLKKPGWVWGDPVKSILNDRENPVVSRLHGTDPKKSISTMSTFAVQRVEGKPYVITEFNNCPPFEFRLETLPLMAAYAARQDWDALVLFTFNSHRDRFQSDEVPRNFFTMHRDPAMLAMMPWAAHLIRRGDLPPAPAKAILKIPHTDLRWLSSLHFNTWGGMTSLWRSLHRVTTELNDVRWSVAFVPDGALHVEESGNRSEESSSPIQWHPNDGGGALFSVNSPKSKAVVCYYPGKKSTTATLPGFSVEFGQSTHHFAVAAVTAMDDSPLANARRVLCVIGGTMANTDFQWDETNAVENWGEAPLRIEVVPTRVKIARQNSATKVYALSETGERTREVPSLWQNGQLEFEANAPIKSLWFEITDDL